MKSISRNLSIRLLGSRYLPSLVLNRRVYGQPKALFFVSKSFSVNIFLCFLFYFWCSILVQCCFEQKFPSLYYRRALLTFYTIWVKHLSETFIGLVNRNIEIVPWVYKMMIWDIQLFKVFRWDRLTSKFLRWYFWFLIT